MYNYRFITIKIASNSAVDPGASRSKVDVADGDLLLVAHLQRRRGVGPGAKGGGSVSG